MSEVISKAKLIFVRKKCDKCGEGFMVNVNGVAYPTAPMKFPHKCNKCGNEESYVRRYPHLEVVLKDEQRDREDKDKSIMLLPLYTGER